MNNRTSNINNIIDGLHVNEDAAAIARRNKMMSHEKSSSSKVKHTSPKSDFSLVKKNYTVTYEENVKDSNGEWKTTTKNKTIKAHSSKEAESTARKEMDKARSSDKVFVFRGVHLES